MWPADGKIIEREIAAAAPAATSTWAYSPASCTREPTGDTQPSSREKIDGNLRQSGHRRKVNGFTAFLGSALLGPFYFLLKGAWPTFLALWLFGVIFATLLALTNGFAPLALLMLAVVNVVIVSPFRSLPSSPPLPLARLRNPHGERITMNWNDPAARLALIEAVGVEEYNARLADRFDEMTVKVVNGHSIRIVDSSRFGQLFLVGDTGSAFAKVEQAEKHANSIAAGKP
ncbi:hypothetical protein [Sinorhizobium terangae]|uniref:hypothetical protein n=1 Tax=Sinorhizobium terangae TaxID=110322 RepID=UPI0024B1722A|nr:hypothetical protein [Sinorhizobium terangae]WFU51159.1 hypothetical protein QA637_21450 [Sinorhizobium terangae]